MADEVVSVKLVSDSKGFVKSFNDAAAAVGNVTKAGIAMAKGFQYASGQVQQEVNRMVQSAKRIGYTVAGVGAATGIMAGLGIKNFASMQTAMANVATVTDTTRVSIGRLQTTLMNMTSTFPRTGEELAAGLYEVQSAGFQGAEALSVMDAATRFSVAGIVDMGTSVRATTSLMNAYGISAYDAIHVTDVLFKAVEEGQMTASEFAINIGDWAASASSLGVSMESAAAALAVMTTKGAMPANLAATSLNSMMRNLIRPTETMSDALKRMGFDSGKAALNTLGFAETLGELWKQAGKNETKFADMFQDVEGFRGALGLVTEGYEKLLDTQERFSNRGVMDGTTNRAFEKQMDTLSAKFALFRNEMRKFSYEIGKLLAPIAETMITIGTTGLRALNGLPAPIRSLLAAVRLLMPALTALAAWLGVMWVKNQLFAIATGKGATMIAKFAMAMGNMTKSTTVAAGIGRVGMAFEAMGKAGGVLPYLRNNIRAFVAANSAMRASMISGAATTLMWGGALTATIVAVTNLVNAVQDARAKAEQLKSTMNKMTAGEIKSVEDLNQAYAETALLNQQLFDKSGGKSLGNSFLASMQMVTPFTENTKINALAASDAMAELAGEYENLFMFSQMLARQTGIDMDSILGAFSRLQAEGSISIERMMQIYSEWMKMLEDEDIQAYERAVAAAASMAAALGQEAPKVDPLDFMSQETYQKYMATKGLIDDTKDKVSELGKEMEKVKEIEDTAGVAAGKFADALFTLGDEAATAADKLDAMQTVIDGLFGKELGQRDLMSNLAESLTKLGTTVAEEGPNFDLWTEGGRKVQEAMSGVGDSFREYLKYIAEHNGPNGVNLAAQEVATLIAQLTQMGENLGWNSDQIAQLLAIMGLTPENIETVVGLPGISDVINKILTTQGLLASVDGTVADAQIRITVSYGMLAPGNNDPNNLGPWAAQEQPSWVQQFQAGMSAISSAVGGAMSSIAGAAGGGGRGGGGGGGGSKWKPSASQLRNMREALSAPLMNLLEGELGEEWQKMAVSRWYDAVTKNMFMEGKTRLGASLLAEAQKSGQDPSEEFEQMVEEYNRLVELVGKASADMAVNQFDTLESFTAFVDKMEELVEHQRDVEDWKYSVGKMGYEEYKKILEARLALYEEYTDEWMEITDQLKSVQEDQIAEEDRMMAARLELDEISKEEYITYLKQRLVALEKYSEEWMSIWREINSAEEELIQQQEDRERGIKDFADAVGEAFNDIKKSVEDPIKSATSLLSAFGDQATVTRDQVTGFYQHMLEGTQRWVTVLRELKSRGINSTFLNELIQAGPQSLTFAESVLGMGTDGISFINQSMAEISNLASGLGTDIARGQVGTLVQNNNSVNITVGDITVTGEFPEGITIEAVQDAIQDALGGIAVNVQNRQSGTLTTSTSVFRPEPV